MYMVKGTHIVLTKMADHEKKSIMMAEGAAARHYICFLLKGRRP